ncbi:MAG: Asp23/Gls24 family envelope stress response protein [Aeromicrobium erythreum]
MSDFALSDLAGRGADRPAAERGTLEVKQRVVERIAQRAALEIGGTVASSRSGLLGLADAVRSPVSVRMLGDRVWLEVDVDATWPCDVAAIGRDVRDHVHDRTSELSGTRVEKVDVTVRLVDPTPSTTRRVQ